MEEGLQRGTRTLGDGRHAAEEGGAAIVLGDVEEVVRALQAREGGRAIDELGL